MRLWPRRYSTLARFYDGLSGEGPIYRAGRVAGIELLGLRPGARVLDLGCGTGLNFGCLQEAVGPTGLVFGLDASSAMLTVAGRRVERCGWDNVRLLLDDAARVAPDTVIDLAGGTVDAVVCTYALSVMSDWRPGWRLMLACVHRDSRLAVVDMRLPDGAARLFSPAVRLAAGIGGVDLRAHPWHALERSCNDVTSLSLRGGHVQVRVGTVAGAPA